MAKFRSFKDHILSFLGVKEFFIISWKMDSVHFWWIPVRKESRMLTCFTQGLGVFIFTAFSLYCFRFLTVTK
jgi:hypothetical protein